MTLVRLAQPEERATIEEVVRAAYALYRPRMGREAGPVLADYAALISQKYVRILIDQSRVLGVLVTLPKENSLLLDNVAVRPEAQGRGYGRRLIRLAEKLARDGGFPSIHLYTNEVMVENVALYGRNGFVETHRVEEDGYRRIYMTKQLGPA